MNIKWPQFTLQGNVSSPIKLLWHSKHTLGLQAKPPTTQIILLFHNSKGQKKVPTSYITNTYRFLISISLCSSTNLRSTHQPMLILPVYICKQTTKSKFSKTSSKSPQNNPIDLPKKSELLAHNQGGKKKKKKKPSLSHFQLLNITTNTNQPKRKVKMNQNFHYKKNTQMTNHP